MSSTLESYELIRFAEAFESRLATAGEMLTGRPGLEAEKGWLATALELVRTSREPSADVLDRVKDLPELEEAREEYAFQQLGLWVDSLEKLQAGITFTASSRAPVIEALFPHLKFPQLRRAPRDVIVEYATSFERRTRSTYVARIFARDDFALVRPVMEQVLTAHAAWRSSHEPAPLAPEVETVLREELVALGRKLDVALRQARLLSEAALVPVPSVYEAAGLGLKPKRRAGRGLALTDDGIPGLDSEPADSMEPTEAELAEVAALDAGGPEHDLAPTEAAASDDDETDLDTPTGDGSSVASATDTEATAASGAPEVHASEVAAEGDATSSTEEGVGATAPARPVHRKKGVRASDAPAAEVAPGRKSASSVDAAPTEDAHEHSAPSDDAPASSGHAPGRKQTTAADARASSTEDAPARKRTASTASPQASAHAPGRKQATGADAFSAGEASAPKRTASTASPQASTHAPDRKNATGADALPTEEASAPKRAAGGEPSPRAEHTQEAARAQGPRVRKKKGASDTAGTETS
ncbi:hypothetical protein LZ198_20355 [Myxococcus sp. K15C18031901]|uniref:hypothetical protein n=1 Tax=Myxococcus dinghuensis TaxID=2906761 RepID=UPI0020A7DF5F|nr:hypothetical protein [Myxococcus dinghuensis]MCP3101230.1 hypothetical protein [Myxococcus dinghuensis]